MPLHHILFATILAGALTTGAQAQNKIAPPPENETTMRWIDQTSIDILTHVPLPNGCHQYQDTRERAPNGATDIENTVAITTTVKVAEGMCSQEYRLHPVNIKISVPSNSIHGVINYVTRQGGESSATFLPFPPRP